MGWQITAMILLGLLTAGLPTVGYFARIRADKRKAGIDEKGVDAQAFERAAGLYAGIISELRTEVDRLRAAVANLENEVEMLRNENTSLRGSR